MKKPQYSGKSPHPATAAGVAARRQCFGQNVFTQPRGIADIVTTFGTRGSQVQILPLRPLDPIFLPYFAPEPCFGGVGARLLSPASPVLALVQGGERRVTLPAE